MTTAGLHLAESCPLGRLLGFLAAPAGVVMRGDRRATAYRRLLGALGDHTDMVIATHGEAVGTVRHWLSAQPNTQFVPVDAAIDFTAWSQDGFLAATTGGMRAVLIPKTTKKPNDQRVAEAFAEALGICVATADFDFEGGNVLVGADFILAGSDRGGSEMAALLKESGDGRPVLVLGTEGANPAASVRLVERDGEAVVEESFGHAGKRQPLFHIDSFVTLAGRGPDGRQRVLVGDSRLAAGLIGDDRVASDEQGFADAFDAVAETLGATGDFEVIRNPLAIVLFDDTGLFRWSRRSLEEKFADTDGLDEVLRAFDRRGLKTIRVRRWRAATQNGAIVFGSTGGTVLLPTYSATRPFLRPAEEKNAAIWTSLGYKVVEVGDFTDFAADNGSAHCLFKPLWPSTATG